MNEIKQKWNNFLFNKIALPIIRKIGDDSNYVKHLDNEMKIRYKENCDCEYENMMHRDLRDLLSLLSTQGDTDFSIGWKLNLFKKAALFKILSPLTFDDSEWRELEYKSGFQNRRLSSVFKENECIYDIDAFSHSEKFVYNVDTKELKDGNNLQWSGCVWFYDEENDNWLFSSAGVINPENKEFMGSNRVVVPSICIIDNTCDVGTFCCNISKLSAIPEKFFKDYSIIHNVKNSTRIDGEFEDLIKPHSEEFKEILKKL